MISTIGYQQTNPIFSLTMDLSCSNHTIIFCLCAKNLSKWSCKRESKYENSKLSSKCELNMKRFKWYDFDLKFQKSMHIEFLANPCCKNDKCCISNTSYCTCDREFLLALSFVCILYWPCIIILSSLFQVHDLLKLS